MKTARAALALPLVLAVSACSGAPDGNGGVDDPTGTSRQAILLGGITHIPTPPVNQVPIYSDLRALDVMQVDCEDPSTGPLQRLMINVQNVGNSAVSAPSGGVVTFLDSGTSQSVELYAYDKTSPANTLFAGQYGYLLAVLPTGTLNSGQSYKVQIDSGRTMQTSNTSTVDVFANDQSSIVAFLNPLDPDACP